MQQDSSLPLPQSSSKGAIKDNLIKYSPSLDLIGAIDEGLELGKDAKHEFRFIVLNILHEWISTANQNFSKIDEDDFLKHLIAHKLGNEYASKIQTAFGGDKITFKSLLAIDEVEDPPRPLNCDDWLKVNQLKKEREVFYSAQCSFGTSVQGDEGVSENPNNKVWERIKDIVDKYNSIEDFHTLNTDFITSFSSALDSSKKISGLSDDDVALLKTTISAFDDKNQTISGAIGTESRASEVIFSASPAPTSNPPQAEPNQDVDKFGELMETALGVIGKAFEDLGKGITISWEEARKNLLEKVEEMEEMTKKPGNAPVNQGDKQTSETPDNNILKPIFSVLKSYLGEGRK